MCSAVEGDDNVKAGILTDGARNIAVIPKSNHQERLRQNIDIFGFSMTEEELRAISALDRGLRFNDPGFYLPNHPLHIFS